MIRVSVLDDRLEKFRDCEYCGLRGLEFLRRNVIVSNINIPSYLAEVVYPCPLLTWAFTPPHLHVQADGGCHFRETIQAESSNRGRQNKVIANPGHLQSLGA